MLQYLNPIKILVLLTFVYFLTKFDRRKKVHLWVFGILLINVLKELVSIYLRYAGIGLTFTSTFYVILHTTAWIGLLGLIAQRVVAARILMAVFLSFAIVNLLAIEGTVAFNGLTLVVGAFCYVGFFIADCYNRLRREDFFHFSSDNYVLTAAPLLFMIGFSILFGFKNMTLHHTMIAGMTLFEIVCYFINLVLYGLLNLYISKQK